MPRSKRRKAAVKKLAKEKELRKYKGAGRRRGVPRKRYYDPGSNPAPSNPNKGTS